MRSEVPLIIEFAGSIGRDKAPDDTVLRNCANLLGDIATVVPGAGALFAAAPSRDWEQLLVACSEASHIAVDTEWAVNAVRMAMQQPAAAS
jgi:hypothetical protein